MIKHGGKVSTVSAKGEKAYEQKGIDEEIREYLINIEKDQSAAASSASGGAKSASKKRSAEADVRKHTTISAEGEPPSKIFKKSETKDSKSYGKPVVVINYDEEE